MTHGDAKVVIFAYGSLKRGHANHRELAAARFIGTARTVEAFALREIDGYPALVPGALAIQGELYEVTVQSLPALDEFEGEGYLRREIALADGARAMAYVARSPEAGSPLHIAEWPSRARPS